MLRALPGLVVGILLLLLLLILVFILLILLLLLLVLVLIVLVLVLVVLVLLVLLLLLLLQHLLRVGQIVARVVAAGLVLQGLHIGVHGLLIVLALHVGVAHVVIGVRALVFRQEGVLQGVVILRRRALEIALPVLGVP